MKPTSIIFFALLLALPEISSAQEWVQTNGPGGGFNSIAFNKKKNMFASGGSLIRSTDGGKNWKLITPSEAPRGISWKIAIAPNDDIYITGISDDSTRIWRSTDNGNSWMRIWLSNIGALFIGPEGNIYIMGAGGSNGTPLNFFRSRDSGKTWKTLPITLNGDSLLSVTGDCNGIDSNGVLLFAIDYGFIRSTDHGNSWNKISIDAEIQSLACTRRGNIFASSFYAAYHSVDGGASWLPIADLTLPYPPGGYNMFISSRVGRILLLGGFGFTYSDDEGKTWEDYYQGDYVISEVSRDADSGFYFSGVSELGGATFHSSFPSAPWELVIIPTGSAYAMGSTANGSIVSYNGSRLWRIDSGGSEWNVTADIGNTIYAKFVIDSSKNILFISTGIYRSVNEGKKWDSIVLLPADITSAVVHPSGFIFVGSVDGGGMMQSKDNGLTWDPVLNFASILEVTSLATSRDGLLYAGTANNDSLYRSDDTGVSWKTFPIGSLDYIENIITDIYGNIFTFGALALPNQHAMCRSWDNGVTWSLFNEGLSCSTIYSMTETPNGEIIAATDKGVFILPLGGCVWQPFSKGLPALNILSIAFNSRGELFAGTDGSGALKNTETFGDAPKFTGIVSSHDVNFDSVATGKTFCRDLVIKNTGFAPFTLNSFTVVDPIPFSITDESAKKIPVTLNPKDSITMSVCFHPYQPAVYASSIIWNTNIDQPHCTETPLHGVAVINSAVINSPEFHFSLHPNPVSGNSLFIFATDELQEEPATLAVYDLLGREVLRQEVETNRQEIEVPVGELASGVYYVHLICGGKIFSKKFVKSEP